MLFPLGLWQHEVLQHQGNTCLSTSAGYSSWHRISTTPPFTIILFRGGDNHSFHKRRHRSPWRPEHYPRINSYWVELRFRLGPYYCLLANQRRCVCAKDEIWALHMLAACFTTRLYSRCIPATLFIGPAPLGSWNFLGSLRKQNFHPIPLR